MEVVAVDVAVRAAAAVVADVVGADGCSTLSAGAVDEVGVGASSLVTAK